MPKASAIGKPGAPRLTEGSVSTLTLNNRGGTAEKNAKYVFQYSVRALFEFSDFPHAPDSFGKILESTNLK